MTDEKLNRGCMLQSQMNELRRVLEATERVPLEPKTPGDGVIFYFLSPATILAIREMATNDLRVQIMAKQAEFDAL